jgi:hypothetical protein
MTLIFTPPRFLLVGGLIAALAITMGFAVSWILTSAVSDWETEHVATVVRGEMANVDVDALFQDPSAPAERWPALLSEIAGHIPAVVRCKVWSHDRVVIWSDDTALIGKHESTDPDLRAALAGRVVFRLVEPDRDDTETAWRSQVLSRIYVPISSATGAVRGVIELRKIPSRLSTNLATALLVVWAIAGAGGVALWLAMRPRARERTKTAEPVPGPVPARSADEILAEIRERFGFIPPFFEPAIATPAVLANLWQQTLSAYVENPLPALFKEKLFAYLSRYCAVPYCIVCHSCALRPLGMRAAEVLRLLDAPPRGDMELAAHLTLLTAQPGPLRQWPAAGSPLETSLIDCAIFMFLNPGRSERCQRELRRLLGADYPRLAEFLAYVKSCHAWVEAHPELAYEADQRARANLGILIHEEPRLAEFFQDYRQRVMRERQAVEQRRLAELEARAAELASANEALRAEIRDAREGRD